MCGYSDLTVYESDAERNAVCAELARMLRVVPLTTSSPATAGPSRDAAGDFIPLDRAVAGTPSTATHFGQVTPSPADTAVRGDLIEQGV